MSDVPRPRVLVIDDQDASRYILRRILTRAGYEVLEASTGASGLDLALTLPDIIIADVNLPDMLGYEVSRRLRANPLTACISIVQISAAFVSDESRIQALEGGADSYLTQPIEPAVLLAHLNALLRLRRAESLSSLSARQWQTTFDALSEGLALVDADGVVVRANRALLDLLGLVPSEIEGQPVARIFESRFAITFAEFLERNQTDPHVELACGPLWVRVGYNKLQADPQNESGAVLLMADITDQKKLRETLKHNERLAATGRLAHIIAHEINNPLEAMANLLYLALEANPSEGASHSYVQQASVELMRISQISKQLLAYHRESKRPVPTPANELLESALAMFRVQMLSNRIDLIAEIRCSSILHVFPGEIRQVFGNLISNSLDAISGNGGRVHVRCSDSTDVCTGDRGVRFIFSDTGTGIPADVYPRIFEAFYTTKNSDGSGIGLWLSAEIIEKHSGSVRVRTRTEGPYRGTLFALFLPFVSDLTSAG